MGRYGVIGVIGILLLGVCRVWSADALDTEAFLERVRYPRAGRSMAAMTGEMQHLRDGGKMETLPVYLGLLIEPEKTRGQLIFGDREGYWIDQIRHANGNVTTAVRPMNTRPEKSLVHHFMLQPTDLTMGFLFYNLVKELPSSMVKAMPCRVLLLEAPEKGEAVRAYLLKNYYFPLKVEFFKDRAAALDGGTPLRTLEVGSFQKQNDLYYAELINLYGPGWRSRVTFRKVELSVPPIGALPPFRGMLSK